MTDQQKPMQGENQQMTRRDVLRGACAMAVLSPLHPALAAADALKLPAFAYVAASGSRQGCIHVFAVGRRKWSKIQRVPAHAPAQILLSHSQRALYVTNDVDTYRGLPRGTVQAFAIDPEGGTLTLLGRQALSLSATHPRAMALSPDGRSLGVAAYGGGILNLLPIAEDGSVGAATHTFKLTGSGPHPQLQQSSHPHAMLFDEASRDLIVSDVGSDRLALFSLDDGKLKRRMQYNSGAGSGPSDCVMHTASSTLFAWHALDGTLAAYPFRRGDGMVGVARQRIVLRGNAAGRAVPAALLLHASGRLLYAGHADNGVITAWKIDEHTGALTHLSSQATSGAGAMQLVAAPDGESLFVVDESAVHRMTTDAASGAMRAPEKLATLTNARWMALKTL